MGACKKIRKERGMGSQEGRQKQDERGKIRFQILTHDLKKYEEKNQKYIAEKHRINFMASKSIPGPNRLIFGLCTQHVSYLRAMTIKLGQQKVDLRHRKIHQLFLLFIPLVLKDLKCIFHL